MNARILSLCLLLSGAWGCAATKPVPLTALPDEQRGLLRAAVSSLQGGRFAEAQEQAGKLLAATPGIADARAVRAVAAYAQAARQLWLDGFTVALTVKLGTMNEQYLRFALGRAERTLAAVDEDLAVAVRDPQVGLVLCPACWRIDWDGDGQIDEADQRLLQIETDADGQDLTLDDSRRRPTFSLDLGDVYWARAMVAFQRAILQGLLAYDLSAVAALRRSVEAQKPWPVTFHLRERQRIDRLGELLLSGLDHAGQARAAFLAETDNDREWVPSPRQSNHGVLLPVDEALYATWAGVLGDLRLLVTGQQGIDLAEAARVLAQREAGPQQGYLNVGALFREPGDIVIDPGDQERAGSAPNEVLRRVLGRGYAQTMARSPLLSRFASAMREVQEGHQTIQRKLKYLLWLN